MKVVDFINKLEELGYDENTEINFGECDYNGNWYKFRIEEFENEGADGISVLFYENEEYIRSAFDGICDKLIGDFENLLADYR